MSTKQFKTIEILLIIFITAIITATITNMVMNHEEEEEPITSMMKKHKTPKFLPISPIIGAPRIGDTYVVYEIEGDSVYLDYDFAYKLILTDTSVNVLSGDEIIYSEAMADVPQTPLQKALFQDNE